jgi:wyosine [tRNA(Phe)-imidazoG37] synthetase (radical SAM superfamily)
VPGLELGTAPEVDLLLLEKELRGFLLELLQGNFMQQHVSEGYRRINDIAISGNGEPTSAKAFVQVMELISRLRHELALPKEIKTVLITNGSLLYRSNVQEGLKLMAQMSGEVWFKLDRASVAGMQLINNTHISMDKVRANLASSIANCPTWLQTCWFAVDGVAPSVQDEDDFLDFIGKLLHDKVLPQGVLLYSLARASFQPEAATLEGLSLQQLDTFANRIRTLGLTVKISA